MLDIQTIRRRNAVRILQERFGGVKAQLASRMNAVRAPGEGLIQASYVTRLLKEGASGARLIGDDMARRIERAGEKPLNWLDQNHAVVESVESRAQFEGSTTQVRKALPTTGSVPLVEWDVDAIPPSSIPADAVWIESAEPLDADTGIALRVEHDLMVNEDDPRTLPVGCYIVVKGLLPPWDPRSGDIVLVRFEGQQRATLRQLILDGDRKLFRVTNPAYQRPPEPEDGITILGTVVERIERTRF